MADRIMAALDYLDAHNTMVFQKQKQQRSLGDIDSKYDMLDPVQVPFHVLTESNVMLTGTSRTNMSREKTLDQILDEDREKVVRSAHRAKSASSQKKPSHLRPHTSLSSGSVMVGGDARRRSYRSPSQSPSSATMRTSTKKLTFTPPGVHVGPTDARDEVMEEIVNKPLTHTPAKNRGSPPARSRTAVSAPALGQKSRLSVGSRSMTSLRRSRTFHGSSKQSDSNSKKQDIKPGPFTTIKVSKPDMWVISSSTPTSYFNGDLADQSMTNGTVLTGKKSSWEDTANSVPREEKKSPPRHERQLGAPPQFGPTHQWYSFAGGEPTKQRPVLSAFADETNSEYYAIESSVGQKVAELLDGSPGIRIGVNGQVVANSMKINKKEEQDECRSDSDESKTSRKIEDKRDDKDINGSEVTSVNSGSENYSESSRVENRNDDKNGSVYTAEEEDHQFSLLRYLGIARGKNPYVVESSSDATSSTDVASILNNLRKGEKNGSLPYNEQEEALWKVLEGASPTLWMDRQKWKQMQMIARVKEERERYEENKGPLSWNDQLKQENGKIIKPRIRSDDENKNTEKNGHIPVVFHKFVDYENLPANFVHLTANGFKSHSSAAAVDQSLNVSEPSKGYNTTVSSSHKTSKSLDGHAPVQVNAKFPPRPFTSEAKSRSQPGKEEDEDPKPSIADIIRLTTGKSSVDSTVEKSKNTDEPEVLIADDVSEEELEAIRLEAAYKMKMTGGMAAEANAVSRHLESRPTSKRSEISQDGARQTAVEKSITLDSLPVKASGTVATVDIRQSKPRTPVPLNSLNLSEGDDNCSVLSAPNTSPLHSERPNMNFVETKESIKSGEAILKDGHDPPLNTPKTPVFHALYSKEEPLSPKHMEHLSSPSTGRLMTEASSARINRGSKSASFISRSSFSPRTNVTQMIGGLPQQLQNRTSEGFVGSSLTSKPTNHRHGSKFVGGMKSAKPNLLVSASSIIPHGNTYADLITKSGYIQISQPLHITSQQKSLSPGASSGNKMYDSYMRELTLRSGKNNGDADFELDKSGVLVHKRLGGSSGKVVHDYLQRTRQQNGTPFSKVKGGHHSFATYGGRRSGLAITNEQARLTSSQMANWDVGDSGLFIQSGQARLNLDKNIHVIYKDLGIPKKSSKPSSLAVSRQNSKSAVFEKNVDRRESRTGSQRGSESRSHPSSAKSERRNKTPTSEPHGMVTPIEIPTSPTLKAESLKIEIHETESDLSLTNGAPVSTDSYPQKENSTKSLSRSTLSSARPKDLLSSDVVDSGTQWSPHENPPSPADEKTEVLKAEELVSQAPIATPESGIEILHQDPKVAAQSAHVENIDEKFETGAQEFAAPEVETVGSKDQQKDPETAELTRSASDSKLTIVNEIDNELADEVDVRGVTKVTVNIAVSGGLN